MRAWKGAQNDTEKIFLYFHAHTDVFFTEDHIAAQTRIGRRRCRRIVAWLADEAKIQSVETVSSFAWGRPKKMFRAIRSNEDNLRQLEVFRNSFAAAGFGDPYA